MLAVDQRGCKRRGRRIGDHGGSRGEPGDSLDAPLHAHAIARAGFTPGDQRREEVVAVTPIVAGVPITDPGGEQRPASRARLLAAVGVAATPAAAAPSGDLLLVAGGFAEERAAAAVLLPGGAGVPPLGPGDGGPPASPAPASRRCSRTSGPRGRACSAPRSGSRPPHPTPTRVPRRRRSSRPTAAPQGCDPPYPAAQAFAAGVVAARCVRDAGTVGDHAVRAAAEALDCTTLFARFRLDPASGQQVGHRVLTVQWQGGERPGGLATRACAGAATVTAGGPVPTLNRSFPAPVRDLWTLRLGVTGEARWRAFLPRP